MRSFILCLLFTGSLGIICPNNYEDGGDGSCYRWVLSGPQTRDQAYNECIKDGAYIMYVMNAFENSHYTNTCHNSRGIWLGITCLNNSTNSCQFDTGAPVTASTYNDFDLYQPNVTAGPCVWMACTSSGQYFEGKWYTADCSNDYNSFACKYTPSVSVPYCDYETPFHGKCYYVLQADVETNVEASTYCTQNDSQQVSIHSEGENNFVKGLAQRSQQDARNPQNQLFLGIGANEWTDDTPVDYQNYGYKNPQLGSCVSMSLSDGIVQAGQWISSPCTASDALTVCKKDIIQPQPVTTMSPLQCNGTQFFSGNGTIYSPGYPEGKFRENCEYLITEDQGTIVQLTLKNVQLDSDSALQLFSGIFENQPFQNLTHVNISSETFKSPTNILRIVYTTAGNSNNLWRGDYQPVNQ